MKESGGTSALAVIVTVAMYQNLNAIPDATVISSIILAYLLDRFFPLWRPVPAPYNLCGWLAVGVGVLAALYTISYLRTRHGSSDVAGTSAALVTTGPYAHSRNPFYVAYVATSLGAAVVLGSLSAFTGPLLCWAVLHFGIIPIEEKRLQTHFGAAYAAYRRTVRRWI